MSLFADCRSQFLLDRVGGCLKLFVSTESTSSHEFASQFGLAFFYTWKTPKNYRENWVSRKGLLNEQALRPIKNGRNAGHSPSIASDKMSGDNSDHSGDRLSQNGEKQQREFIPSRLEKCGLRIIT